MQNNHAPHVFRSVLFAPASGMEILRKLPRTKPDAAIIDLEDGVATGSKNEARAIARQAALELTRDYPELKLFIRVNAAGTDWFYRDIAEALIPELTGVVLPKYERVEQLEELAGLLEQNGLGHLAIILGIETVAGVEKAGSILRSPASLVYFGAEDFITDLGGQRTVEGLEVLYARSRVAIAARLAGFSALDQVVINFKDEARFLNEAAQARSLGYAGKMCIHPSQVPLTHKAFSPDPKEVDRARRLVEDYEKATAEGKGVIAFEGQMVDLPLVLMARGILARAGVSDGN